MLRWQGGRVLRGAALACALAAYVGSYVARSARGRYEPMVIGLGGVKWYDWAPEGFVGDGWEWNETQIWWYYPLWQLDRRFWHQPLDGSLWRDPSYPIDEIPADEIGTDRHRLESWTPAAAEALNGLGEGHDWKFSHYRKTSGYVARPLDGIWLRAPYLHNGSVPTLAALLAPADQRPARFWRGYDVLDTRDVGFIVSGPEAERAGTLFDTQKPGNGNGGHLYGTDLPADSKRSLIEYLKTL